MACRSVGRPVLDDEAVVGGFGDRAIKRDDLPHALALVALPRSDRNGWLSGSTKGRKG